MLWPGRGKERGSLKAALAAEGSKRKYHDEEQDFETEVAVFFMGMESMPRCQPSFVKHVRAFKFLLKVGGERAESHAQ